MNRFLALYEEELRKATQEHPEEYGFGLAEVPVVLAKMTAAFLRGSYNKDGRAIKAVCRRLKIPWTYKAINAALAEPLKAAWHGRDCGAYGEKVLRIHHISEDLKATRCVCGSQELDGCPPREVTA